MCGDVVGCRRCCVTKHRELRERVIFCQEKRWMSVLGPVVAYSRNCPTHVFIHPFSLAVITVSDSIKVTLLTRQKYI